MADSLNDTSLSKVKFVDDTVDFSAPVEPALARRLQAEERDLRLSSPTPSVLQALSTCSVSLYDLGVQSGITWAHDWLEHDHRTTLHDGEGYKSTAYNVFTKMVTLVDRKRPHLFRSYAEGWLNGWQAATNLTV